VVRVVYAVSKGLHYVAGALIIGVMVMTVYNVLGRWLFGAPLRGTVELTQLAMIGIVYLGLAYAQERDNHISVDLLYQRLGKRTRYALDAFTTLLSVIVLALLAWQLSVYAGVLEAGNRTTASRSIPLYPFAYVAMVGVAAFILALVSTLITRVRSPRQDDVPEASEQAFL
jgi:TRAP-type C4-dicarboxylate transport system permease small subunit